MIKHSIKLFNNFVFTRCINNEREPIKRTIFMGHLNSPSSVYHCTNQNKRFKSKNSKKEVSESGSDSYANDSRDGTEDKYTKILKINVTSLRVDGVLKSSLGMARNKVESLFYESKIRINGNKIQKKSTSVQEGDEIDLIKGPDVKNPNFTNVARVEIISIKGNEDSISMKVKRCKSMSVDKYT